MSRSRPKTPAQRLLAALDRVLFILADIELPSEPGVYFVATKSGKILYIGQSKNMLRRWRDGHHRALECLRNGAHYIYYQYTQEPFDLEQIYIEEYAPPINKCIDTFKGGL